MRVVNNKNRAFVKRIFLYDIIHYLHSNKHESVCLLCIDVVKRFELRCEIINSYKKAFPYDKEYVELIDTEYLKSSVDMIYANMKYFVYDYDKYDFKTDEIEIDSNYYSNKSLNDDIVFKQYLRIKRINKIKKLTNLESCQ